MPAFWTCLECCGIGSTPTILSLWFAAIVHRPPIESSTCITRGVAKYSYHIKGMAVDLRSERRDLNQIRDAALSLRCGGVGYYPRSDFVHVDCGPIRRW